MMRMSSPFAATAPFHHGAAGEVKRLAVRYVNASGVMHSGTKINHIAHPELGCAFLNLIREKQQRSFLAIWFDTHFAWLVEGERQRVIVGYLCRTPADAGRMTTSRNERFDVTRTVVRPFMSKFANEYDPPKSHSFPANGGSSTRAVYTSTFCPSAQI
jgi:hypothetical protein